MERGGINESRKYRVRNRCGCRGGRGSLHGSGWEGTQTELDMGLQSKQKVWAQSDILLARATRENDEISPKKI